MKKDRYSREILRDLLDYEAIRKVENKQEQLSQEQLDNINLDHSNFVDVSELNNSLKAIKENKTNINEIKNKKLDKETFENFNNSFDNVNNSIRESLRVKLNRTELEQYKQVLESKEQEVKNSLNSKIEISHLENKEQELKQFFNNKLAELIGSAPEDLNTIYELANYVKGNNNELMRLFSELANKLNINEFNSFKTLIANQIEVKTEEYRGITKSEVLENVNKLLANWVDQENFNSSIDEINMLIEKNKTVIKNLSDTYANEKENFVLKNEIELFKNEREIKEIVNKLIIDKISIIEVKQALREYVKLEEVNHLIQQVINDKISQESFETLSNQVSALNEKVLNNETNITSLQNSKADITKLDEYYKNEVIEQKLANKVNASTFSGTLETELQKKVDVSYLNENFKDNKNLESYITGKFSQFKETRNDEVNNLIEEVKQKLEAQEQLNSLQEELNNTFKNLSTYYNQLQDTINNLENSKLDKTELQNQLQDITNKINTEKDNLYRYINETKGNLENWIRSKADQNNINHLWDTYNGKIAEIENTLRNKTDNWTFEETKKQVEQFNSLINQLLSVLEKAKRDKTEITTNFENVKTTLETKLQQVETNQEEVKSQFSTLQGKLQKLANSFRAEEELRKITRYFKTNTIEGTYGNAWSYRFKFAWGEEHLNYSKKHVDFLDVSFSFSGSWISTPITLYRTEERFQFISFIITKGSDPTQSYVVNGVFDFEEMQLYLLDNWRWISNWREYRDVLKGSAINLNVNIRKYFGRGRNAN